MSLHRERFTALHGRTGANAVVAFDIARPEPVSKIGADHVCRVVISGIVECEWRILGASAAQACELAFLAVRQRLAVLESDWRLFDSRGHAVTFDHQDPARAPGTCSGP